jgi:hypothetical protein
MNAAKPPSARQSWCVLGCRKLKAKTMHQRAGEKQEIRQRAESVRPMLGQKEEGSGAEESRERQAEPGPVPGLPNVVVRRHRHIIP